MNNKTLISFTVAHEEMHRKLHSEDVESCLSVYYTMADILRGRGMVNAFAGGALSVIVYISFLKYLSDRKDELGIHCSDNFRYDALCMLYPRVISQRDIIQYLIDVEEQLGFARGMFYGLTFPEQEREFDEQFQRAMEVGQRLDFSSEKSRDAGLEALLRTVERLAESGSKASPVSYTPSPLSVLMAKLLKIEEGMSLYDPCAGIGLLLSRLMKSVDITVYAQEKNVQSAILLEMILIMSGMSRGLVTLGDSAWSPLTLKLETKFDRILCDPPYLKPESSYRPFTNEELFGHILYYPEERIEDPWILVRHIMAELKPDGRAVVVLPMSMVTREGSVGKVRQRIIEDGYIESVVELPSGAYPFTGIKTTILVIQKGKPKRDIFFLDLSQGKWDGKKDCEAQYIDMVLNHTPAEGFAGWASFEEIARNGFQLAAARYVSAPISAEQFLSDPVKLHEDARTMEQEFRKLCDDYEEELAEYNKYLDKKN